MDINALKDSFIKFYYQLYDGNRSELKNLYAENSMITMNGSNASGSSQIVAQLQTLPVTFPFPFSLFPFSFFSLPLFFFFF